MSYALLFDNMAMRSADALASPGEELPDGVIIDAADDSPIIDEADGTYIIDEGVT